MILAHELHRSQAGAERWMLFLHGILGRRANWRSIARRWLEARPGWGAVLVDLREHGNSQGFPPPHDVASAAADLRPLCAAVEAEAGGSVAGLLGHSFGGKVAVAGATGLLDEGHALEELWIIDAPMGPRTSEGESLTGEVFAALRSLPPRLDSRADFSAALVSAGLSKPTAMWLATSAVELPEEQGGGWRFGPQLPNLDAMVEDFARVDLWPTLEALCARPRDDMGRSEALRVGWVLGGRSTALSASERARAEAAAAAGRLAVEHIPEAGHWVHSEAPKQLLAILEQPPKVGPRP
ncbi:alpha/beta hydrolase [Pseudenhygromyxa sp. WMMC2535]|uniref:alpha/beta fold hydrolase n=1 Tax=Pseudenhygromyxa sp. WMMC2535 TaxID=2712867 RepID=UPI0015537C37|nr:alpha/beta hydrolase [Pseudenhygromyxa sp. WMMC2535]NVB41211.1 alpha/beta hydrolase [Pseudenhygromyxa sp. WMMC2535]